MYTRRWIWTALALQGLGYLFDALWHGVLSPGVEPHTLDEMIRHLATVHLPLYVGALGTLATTAAALALSAARSTTTRALWITAAGAVISAGAEAWHAASHLRLDTHQAPLAGTLSFMGFLLVLISMAASRQRPHRATDTRDTHRAA